MTHQRYEVDILRESVLLGNDAIFKCSIPSHVSDFVLVEAWLDSEGRQLGPAAGLNGNGLAGAELDL